MAIFTRMHRPRQIGVVAFALLAAACTAPRPAPPPPADVRPLPRPAAAPVPPPPADWRDMAQTPGNWTWADQGGRSTARFDGPGGAALAMLTCDRAARQIVIGRRSTASGVVPMQITTTFAARPLLTEAGRGPAGWQAAAVGAGDALLDAMAISRGRFMIEVGGEAPLYLPAWPEVARVIEDCR